MTQVTPFLWFGDQAEEAVQRYVSVVPSSRIVSSVRMQSDSPSGPPGSVQVIEFELGGRPFTAMNAKAMDPFNHAVSLMIGTADQVETDRVWEALLADGGEAEACGWLKDRYGVSWQVTPIRLSEMLRDPDPARAKRASDAMMTMVKIDIAALERAYAGETA